MQRVARRRRPRKARTPRTIPAIAPPVRGLVVGVWLSVGAVEPVGRVEMFAGGCWGRLVIGLEDWVLWG